MRSLHPHIRNCTTRAGFKRNKQPDEVTTIFQYTVDSRLTARGLTALRLNRGKVFLKKKFYFP
jgi:hypothetical protein